MSELMEEVLEEEEISEKFVVDNDIKAQYCLEQIAAKRAQIAEWKAHYEATFKRVKDQLEGSIAWYESNLRQYFRECQENGITRKTKSQIIYDLPGGKIVQKHQEPKVERDDEKILAWLDQNAPDLVKVKREPDWMEMKNRFTFSEGSMVTDDAEIIPGVTVTPQEDIIKVEVKKG